MLILAYEAVILSHSHHLLLCGQIERGLNITISDRKTTRASLKYLLKGDRRIMNQEDNRGRQIISIKNGIITLSNPLGCRLVISPSRDGYGLGAFYYKNLKLGSVDSFINKQYESFIRISSGTPYYEVIKPITYKLPNYEVVKNTTNEGIIRFYGEVKDLKMNVTLTLAKNSHGYRVDYEIKPFKDSYGYDVFKSKSLYVEIPFRIENSEVFFVQYPFEAPLTKEFKGVWSIIPRRSMVPFMFSCRKLNGQKYFLGVGYHLSQPYYKGRLEYDAESETFRIYMPEEPSLVNGAYSLSIIISTANSQADCIRGYMQQSGYDINTPVYGSIEKSISLLMSVYKNAPAYEEGMGYHQCIDLDIGKPSPGYGKYIPVCANVPLAYNLYEYWRMNPKEEWARKRALEIVEFFIKSQDENGAVPTLYDPEKRRYLTYIEEVREWRKAQGKDVSYIPRGYFLYTTHMMAMAAYYLYRLYLKRKSVEGIDEQRWRESALKVMDYLMSRVEPSGLIGRNYNRNGEYDDICANVWFLIALDYFHTQTGDKKFEQVRRRVEKWVYKTFAEMNHWYNWSADGGWWRGEGPPPINHDAFEIPTWITYCLYRYIKTHNEWYLQAAKDSIFYLWLCMIPIQYPGYKRVTKGLIKEQDFYSTYDVPFNTCRLFDCLPYLTVITGDRFYMEFYRLLVQTQIAYQAVDRKYPAFYIGLNWNEADEYGEPNIAYIVEFAGCMFLDSVNSPFAYRYVGGRDWCIGLDYDPPFKPSFKAGEPYIVFASSRVISAWWKPDEKALYVILEGPMGSEGVLCVEWNSKLYPIDKVNIKYNDGEEVKARKYYDKNTKRLNIKYRFVSTRTILIKIFYSE